MKKIGIDARFFGTIGKGLGRYTQKLIEELEKTDKDNLYFIFIRKENFDEYIPQNPNFTKVLADISWYSLEEQIKMTILLNRYNLDLVHFPHFNVPLFYRKDYVVTIHDLILIEYPTRKASKLNSFMYYFKNLVYKIVIRNAIFTSKKVITISKYTEKSILKNFNIKKSKINMIYEGVDLEKFNLQNEEEFDYKKFNIEKNNFLLYVGNAYPHKNIDGLILAFKKLIQSKDINPNLKLLLIGKHDYFYKQIIQLVKKNDLQERVILPGFVNDNQLISLFHNCKLYIFPSFYEGFGLPPLEALALDAKLVLSNATCLPEIFEDSATYFDPNNEPSIIKAIKESLTTNKKLDPIIKNKILNKYSWEDMAERTKTVYNKIREIN